MSANSQLTMQNRDLWSEVPKAWRSVLANCAGEISTIGKQLIEMETAGVIVLPEWEKIFAALTTPPNQVRVIIIGQDPYPNPEHAIGVAFAVPNTVAKLPPSLRNILKQLHAEFPTSAVDSSLSLWIDQGVLLINSSLSVTSGKPGSHQKLGWETVVIELLRAVQLQNPDVVALLWGNLAIKLGQKANLKNIISGVHPSPLSANRGFFGSQPFTRVNHLLVESGQQPIVW